MLKETTTVVTDEKLATNEHMGNFRLLINGILADKRLKPETVKELLANIALIAENQKSMMLFEKRSVAGRTTFPGHAKTDPIREPSF